MRCWCWCLFIILIFSASLRLCVWWSKWLGVGGNLSYVGRSSAAIFLIWHTVEYPRLSLGYVWNFNFLMQHFWFLMVCRNPNNQHLPSQANIAILMQLEHLMQSSKKMTGETPGVRSDKRKPGQGSSGSSQEHLGFRSYCPCTPAARWTCTAEAPGQRWYF